MGFLKGLIFTTSFLIQLFALSGVAKEHPFLLVKASDYAALRARATQTPWKEWKEMALAQAEILTFPVDGTIDQRSYAHRDIEGTCALAYLLTTDSAKKAVYRQKILTTQTYWQKQYSQIDLTNIRDTSGSGNAFVISVLALDIIWPDLTPEQRAQAVNNLRPPEPWPFQVYQLYWSTKLTWALFLEDTAGTNLALSEFDAELFGPKGPNGKGYIGADGAYFGGTEYGTELFENSTRLGKYLSLDILKSMEIRDYDQRYVKYFHWIYVYARNPFNHPLMFGDSWYDTLKPDEVLNNCGIHNWSVEKFGSTTVTGLGLWRKRGCTPALAAKGTVLPIYLLTKSVSGQPVKPTSTLFTDGGAVFWDEDPTPNALMAALWNVRNSEYHSHQDTNSIYVAGYGEHLISNSGVYSYTNSLPGYSQFGPGWFMRNAASGNTVTINGVNHAIFSGYSASGNGLSEGFTSPMFDYASGDSGQALPNGHHQRNFVFVHPQDGAVGYFLIMDEVRVNSAKESSIQQYLHPMSDQVSVIGDKREYQWKITGPFIRNSAKSTFVNIFLASAPSNVLLKDGFMVNSTIFLKSKYMESTFQTDSLGAGEILTGIFPHDATHAKPTVSRLNVGGTSGIQVDFKNVLSDIAFVSKGSSEVSHAGMTFKGKGMVARLLNGTAASFYFVREGTLFSAPDKAAGFQSESPVSLHLRGSSGKINSPGTNVIFYAPQVKSVLLDGKAANTVSQVSGKSLKVFVPKGKFSLKVLSEGQAVGSSPKPPTQVTATVESGSGN